MPKERDIVVSVKGFTVKEKRNNGNVVHSGKDKGGYLMEKKSNLNRKFVFEAKTDTLRHDVTNSVTYVLSKQDVENSIKAATQAIKGLKEQRKRALVDIEEYKDLLVEYKKALPKFKKIKPEVVELKGEVDEKRTASK